MLTLDDIYKLDPNSVETLLSINAFVSELVPVIKPPYRIKEEDTIESLYERFINREIGGWCGLTTEYMRILLNKCGISAYVYNYGFRNTQFTHTVIVANGYLLDPYFNKHYVDATGRLMSLETLLRMITDRDFSFSSVYESSIKTKRIDIVGKSGFLYLTGREWEETLMDAWAQKAFHEKLRSVFGDDKPCLLMLYSLIKKKKSVFFKRMIENLATYFNDTYKQAFTNQTVDSCEAIYNLCKNENPESVVEMGTNHGASTFALAMAMNDLGKDLSCITSIDLDHLKWKESFKIQDNLLNNTNLEIEKIKTITDDFNNINPEDVIDTSKKTFVFYDMHDHKGPWSQRLLDLWVPMIKTGLIAVHDIGPVDESFELIQDEKSPRSKIQYMDGQYFAGFNECARIINWANKNEIKVKIFSGGIYFKMR